jgi:V8-like Glu-specific endopeptidase
MKYAAPFEVLESPFLNEEIVSRPADGEVDSVEEEVLGKDDRTLVPDTLKVPHRWICAIDVMSENPKWGSQGQPRFISKSRATGILIGPRYVLTARHVFSHRDDAAVNQHTISPARNGSNSKNPFGTVTSVSIHRSQPYFIRRRVRQGSKIIEIPLKQHDDYALVILDKDIASSTHAKITGALGYWGVDPAVAVVRRLDPAVLQNKDIAVTGYPGDTCAKSKFTGTRSAKEKQIEHCWNRRNDEWASTQWTAAGTLDVEADSTTLFHTAGTYDGQSGAPICLSVDGQLHLAGVHTAPDNAQRNRGVRVTRRMLRELCEWINADAGYAAASIQNDTLTLQPSSTTGGASVDRAASEIDEAFEPADADHELDGFHADEDGGLNEATEALLEFDELESGDLLPREEGETPKAVGKKLKVASFPSHIVEVKGSDTMLTASSMDPGFYDGAKKYKVADPLQTCLSGVMTRSQFSHIKTALVDLTKSAASPDFAGFNHKSQVFAASVPKIAAMLGAFQLRHDLRAALRSKGSKAKTLDEFFPLVRAGLAGAAAAPYPKAPELERVVADVKAGNPLAIEFKSTGETRDQLEAIIDDYNATADKVGKARKALIKAKGNAAGEKAARKLLADALPKFAAAKAKVGALGFLERLRAMMGGLIPASNYATGTIVRDVGFVYIASTLVQSGLYDNERNGGLWLARDYAGTVWKNGLALGSGISQSATAGSLAAFMTLLAQGRLVSPAASAEMSGLIQKEPNPTHPGIVSWFKEGLTELKDQGSIKRVLSKLGALKGIDDCALIEREVGAGASKKTLRYVAIGLRARTKDEMKSLILELDKCILANNGVSAADGGHS